MDATLERPASIPCVAAAREQTDAAVGSMAARKWRALADTIGAIEDALAALAARRGPQPAAPTYALPADLHEWLAVRHMPDARTALVATELSFLGGRAITPAEYAVLREEDFFVLLSGSCMVTELDPAWRMRLARHPAEGALAAPAPCWPFDGEVLQPALRHVRDGAVQHAVSPCSPSVVPHDTAPRVRACAHGDGDGDGDSVCADGARAAVRTFRRIGAKIDRLASDVARLKAACAPVVHATQGAGAQLARIERMFWLLAGLPIDLPTLEALEADGTLPALGAMERQDMAAMDAFDRVCVGGSRDAGGLRGGGNEATHASAHVADGRTDDREAPAPSCDRAVIRWRFEERVLDPMLAFTARVLARCRHTRRVALAWHARIYEPGRLGYQRVRGAFAARAPAWWFDTGGTL